MPVVKTPLPKFTDLPGLRKAPKTIVDSVKQRVRLYVEQKRIKLRLEGDKKRKVTGLNYELFSILRHAIPDPDVKSFEFDIEDEDDGTYDGRYQVSMIQYEKGQDRLDKVALISTPWKVEVKCPCKCGKKFKVDVTLPPNVLAAATKEGKVPDPTVSVTRIGGSGDEDDDGE